MTIAEQRIPDISELRVHFTVQVRRGIHQPSLI